MEIIKKGNPKKIQKTCSDCDAIFTYEKKDVNWEITGSKDRGKENMRGVICNNVVDCPCCKKQIIVD